MLLNFLSAADRKQASIESLNDTQPQSSSVGVETDKRYKKVMIINDDNAIIEAVKYNLQSAGYHVVAHTKSLGILSTIMDERPDLILLDIKLPLLDGPMLCRLIQKNQMLSQTPIFIYSSLSEKQMLKCMAECKVQGYIRKTSGMKELVKKVSQYLPLPSKE
jgi:two-component system, OmpR family, alkaline phosphatase synthesis response regulator PhoP